MITLSGVSTLYKKDFQKDSWWTFKILPLNKQAEEIFAYINKNGLNKNCLNKNCLNKNCLYKDCLRLEQRSSFDAKLEKN